MEELSGKKDLDTALLLSELREVKRRLHEREVALLSIENGYSVKMKDIINAKEAAEEANRGKSRFLATMSHEIRTPMNAIIGIAQIQLQKEGLPEEYATALEKIHSSGNNMLEIINDILDMSKIETEQVELRPSEYGIRGLISDAVQVNAVRIGKKPIELKLDVDENVPSKLYGDELRLKQILNNLLSNAIKYTRKGRVKLSVSHYAVSAGGNGVPANGKKAANAADPRLSANGNILTDGSDEVFLRFTVSDTGQGMRPEDRERLFSEYLRFNADANRGTEGTGLGLSITKRLVEAMGGSITVESEYGKGSKFTVTVRQKSVPGCAAVGAVKSWPADWRQQYAEADKSAPSTQERTAKTAPVRQAVPVTGGTTISGTDDPESARHTVLPSNPYAPNRIKTPAPNPVRARWGSQRQFIIFSASIFAAIVAVGGAVVMRDSGGGSETQLFVAMLVVIALIFVMFNLFISGFLRSQRRTMESLEATSRFKSEFLASMSHEIRTPMNTIAGIAQIQLQKENMPPEYAEAFRRIHTSGSGLLGILNDILDLSKIETGRLELASAEYDLPSLLNDAVQLNIVRIGSKPIRLTLDVSENLPARLYGDELRLKQILNYFLSNAIKYTEKGSVRLAVRHLAWGASGRRKMGTGTFASGQAADDGDILLRFTVSDTGCGMTPEDRSRLFAGHAYINVPANRVKGGTGLKMGITKRLIEMMGGSITIESEYGRGTTFTATVRQTAVAGETIGAATAERLRDFTFTKERLGARMTFSRTPMPYGSVLVVDDVETNLYVAVGLLKPYGLNIVTAKSGTDAIDRVKNGERYDVIFMDHMMPKMDGVEATKIIRELNYDGPVVALTANALVGNDEMFARHGFDGFISKPVDIGRLDGLLNKFVRDRHPQEAKMWEFKTTGAVDGTGSEQAAVSPKMLEIFRRDAEKAAVTLRETLRGGDTKLFTITAHAIKSAAANVGEEEISKCALELEKAGRRGDAKYISANTDDFIERLHALIEKLTPEDDGVNTDDLEEDTAFLKEQLQSVITSCQAYDDDVAYASFGRLREKSWKKETARAIEDIYDALYLQSDFEGAADGARTLLSRFG
ncbi:MAG: ATP-binding protein [Chitinispirillia bacterium]|nr:ATP-binding protein [Chitinispirillia bacterium]MCL2241360.1 ATP-binding protein [Chitinispirillia bacterium]